MIGGRTHEKRLRRIGIPAHVFTGWGGGIDFLRLIASSLRHADPEIELHVLVPARGIRTRLRNLKDSLRSAVLGSARATSPIEFEHIERAFMDSGSILHLIDHGTPALISAVKRLRLEAILPAISPPHSVGIPWVGYIYDFQHKHLPQFFKSEECANRDRDFEHMLNCADAVIVNAYEVAKDIERFFPRRRAKVFVMPFCPAPGRDSFSVDVPDAQKRYGVRRPYFIVCNQFWKHKDHRTAFEAFAKIARDRPDLLLVCTGATGDYRFPHYFDELMQDARRAKIADRILILGLIPKPDQLALLRGAIGLIQPTLFEGGPGGGAVYDSVAVGQLSIVSDIAVNSEIFEPMIRFFAAGSADSLAGEMNSALQSYGERANASLDVEKLTAQGVERRRACGFALLDAVRQAVHSFERSRMI